MRDRYHVLANHQTRRKFAFLSRIFYIQRADCFNIRLKSSIDLPVSYNSRIVTTASATMTVINFLSTYRSAVS